MAPKGAVVFKAPLNQRSYPRRKGAGIFRWLAGSPFLREDAQVSVCKPSRWFSPLRFCQPPAASRFIALGQRSSAPRSPPSLSLCFLGDRKTGRRSVWCSLHWTSRRPPPGSAHGFWISRFAQRGRVWAERWIVLAVLLRHAVRRLVAPFPQECLSTVPSPCSSAGALPGSTPFPATACTWPGASKL